jgi:hypothetical protein
MTNSNNDIEELEELLTELEGQEARIVTPYSEEDDAVTRLMDAPLGDQDWMVQVTALDRRMMSNSQVLSELQAGKINGRTLVWRGGMDDWLPVSRVDELARISAPPVSMPRASTLPVQRPAFTNLAPPPPPPPAQPSQPLWSGPPSAPLPPPPSAMSPPIGIAHGGGLSSSVGLPPPPMVLTPPPPPPNAGYGVPKPIPVAAVPAPLPGGNSFGSNNSFSSGNTTRPVAIDFSDVADNDPPLQSKRWVMALSAVAILAVFVTVYSLSSGGGGEGEAKQAAAAEPRAVNALQPASAAPKEKAAASTAPAAAPTRAEAPTADEPATAKANVQAEAEEGDERSSERSSASSARQNAPARYAMRSEYRRRTRGGSGAAESPRAAEVEEPTPAPAAAVPSSAREEEEAAPSSEPVAAADEVDEPPKSAGKSGNTFNREAAKSALDDAAEQAKNCRPQGGPSGSGQVQVRYEPSGKVANVAILTSKFDNTTTGSCVRMLFRRAKVPEFAGAPVVVVNKTFEIP